MGIMARRACELGKRSDKKAVRQSAAQCSARNRAGATAGTRNSPSSTRIEPTHKAKWSREALPPTVVEEDIARTCAPERPSEGLGQDRNLSRDLCRVNPCCVGGAATVANALEPVPPGHGQGLRAGRHCLREEGRVSVALRRACETLQGRTHGEKDCCLLSRRPGAGERIADGACRLP